MKEFSPKTGKELAIYLKEKLTTLFIRNNVNFAYLGGSWAENRQYIWSDIDIFISIPNFINLNAREQLHFLTRLHIDATDLTGFEEIQIVIMENLPLHIQFEVLSNGILLFEKNRERRLNFIEKVLVRYEDFMIWYRHFLK